MRNLKNRKTLYVVLFVVVLVLNALPIIFRDDAAITKYSIVSIAFAIYSVVETVIAFILKDKGAAVGLGITRMFERAIFWSLIGKEYEEDDVEYKNEFERSAFIYCITIPTYITLSFFAESFPSALLQALGLTILRLFALIIVVTVPRLIIPIKEKKQQRLKDEADRKEQERRESMGKWK